MLFNSSSPAARQLPAPLIASGPLTALAPMQDVTDLPFMRVIAQCGAPDYFFTEYFRVHANSKLERHILASIEENATGRPIFAQMIGEDVEHLRRAAKDLQAFPVAGIDLNMGCPAPVVYKKRCGGGLLRDPLKIDQILGALRQSIPGLFTVKMRIGFEDTENFETILDLINKHQIDLLSLHGRTVKHMYRPGVRYDCIREAVQRVQCPVLANGDVSSAVKAKWILEYTGAAGVMIGRHAIRNPWIFRQIREFLSGNDISRIPLSEVNSYVKQLYHAVARPEAPESAQVNKMKKYLNFVGLGVDAEGAFLHQMRRAKSKAELFALCDVHMPPDGAGLFADEPFEHLDRSKADA